MLKISDTMKRSLLTFHLVVTIVVFLYAALIYILFPHLVLRILVWTLFTELVCAVFLFKCSSLLMDTDGEPLQRLNAANIITLARILLVPSISLFLFNGFPFVGAALYALGASLDIVDGLVARRFDRVTKMGVMLDPLGDILTTFVVFFYFWSRSLVPDWLFAILLIRYAEFFAGLAILAGFGAIPRLKATIAGKVAAVVQGPLILFLIILPALPEGAVSTKVISSSYYVLGFAFVSVIISQSIIGIKALYLKRSMI
ncbi:MAG: hypothetical protein B6D63_02505 [Candidatus Latescibacteria bacterium 4484_7]|nr:MAG: hypothetical protein B6D63_02505 [Candidatus Latescibacteria bacterium 4484_7]